MFKKILLLLFILLIGCSGTPPAVSSPSPTVTERSIGPVSATTMPVPDVKEGARAYLEAWKAEDYDEMYALLTQVSKDAINLEEFTRHYQSVWIEAALESVDYEILSALMNPEQAQVSYEVTLRSRIVGDVVANTTMNLRLEEEQWRVQWDDTLVLPQLAGGNYLGLDLQIPARANIYDRDGLALVAQADATAIGIVPDQIDPDQEGVLFAELTRLTGLREDTIRLMYEDWPSNSGWYLPLAEVPSEEAAARAHVLSGLSGLVTRSAKWRYYFDGGIAPHVIGYVSQIQEDEVEEFKRRGYRQDERVGRMGLERWGEEYLGGKRGGALYVFNSQGQLVTKLAEVPPQPSQAIYTTLDREFQLGVQQALAGFPAAAVVLERDTGRVLAIASSPGFDPNAFEPSNFNFAAQLQDINSNPLSPLLNRAAQGQYPLGSVFKLITMAAGLESDFYTPETTYQCGYNFTELQGLTLYDWTWERLQRGENIAPSGLLTLQGGLIRSCNPYFWHIGLDLYNRGLTTAVADMARGFGLGSATGIQGIFEAEGRIPDTNSEVDAVNQAIGQGDVLVTPLQVAAFVAAIGNGGSLYQPQLIERIAPPEGEPTFTFEPKLNGTLPLSPENIQAIQEAMVGVISSTNPRGTAQHRFLGINVPVAGKTGTAQAGFGEPHAWFAGYTFAEREDKPDIAIAVVVENVGEGSDYAAPIFRRILELYYNEKAYTRYWWESSIGLTATPTSEVTETPTPEPEESSE